jgi:hypothetical protein
VRPMNCTLCIICFESIHFYFYALVNY